MPISPRCSSRASTRCRNPILRNYPADAYGDEIKGRMRFSSSEKAPEAGAPGMDTGLLGKAINGGQAGKKETVAQLRRFAPAARWAASIAERTRRDFVSLTSRPEMLGPVDGAGTGGREGNVHAGTTRLDVGNIWSIDQSDGELCKWMVWLVTYVYERKKMADYGGKRMFYEIS